MTQSTQPLSTKLSRSSVETDPIADELRRYDDHLRNVRGLAAGTRHDRCRIVAQLLRKKFAGGVVNMAKLRPVDVRRFIARQLEESHSHSAAAQLASVLRSISDIGRSAATRLPGCSRPFPPRCNGSLHRCRAPSSRTKFNGCWVYSPTGAGPDEATPSSAAHWTWDCVLARSRTC